MSHIVILKFIAGVSLILLHRSVVHVKNKNGAQLIPSHTNLKSGISSDAEEIEKGDAWFLLLKIQFPSKMEDRYGIKKIHYKILQLNCYAQGHTLLSHLDLYALLFLDQGCFEKASTNESQGVTYFANV